MGTGTLTGMESLPDTALPAARGGYTTVQGHPVHFPSGVTREDYLLVYGPLGIMSAIFLAIIAVLWRDRNAQRKEFLEALARQEATMVRLEDQRRAESAKRDEQIVQLAREANETSRALSEKWAVVVEGLRGTIESTSRRIGRRE